MGLTGLRSIGQQLADGRFHYATYFRPSIVSAGVARWIDASYGSGIPKFNAYAGSPLQATPLVGSGNNGIFLGAPDGQPRYLTQWAAYFSGLGPIPVKLNLCDYLMFYPLIDCDDDTPQALENPVPLPRYADGVGVQMFMVTTVANSSNATCTVQFTDTNDQLVDTTFTFTSSTVGVVASSGVGNAPGFIPLRSAKGVKSVQSVQFSVPCGGFAALVLVKPLVNIMCIESEVASEKSFGPEWMNIPAILPGAYLHLLLNCGSSAISNLRSDFLFTY